MPLFRMLIIHSLNFGHSLFGTFSDYTIAVKQLHSSCSAFLLLLTSKVIVLLIHAVRSACDLSQSRGNPS